MVFSFWLVNKKIKQHTIQLQDSFDLSNKQHFIVNLCCTAVWFRSTLSPLFKRFHHLLVYVIFFHRKENNNIFVDDLKEEGEKRPIPNPCRTFLEAFELYPEIMENIERVGFVKPTPIQVWASQTGWFYFLIYLSNVVEIFLLDANRQFHYSYCNS